MGNTEQTVAPSIVADIATNSKGVSAINPKREYWIDYVKTVACILVMSGHLLQGFVDAGILPRNGFFEWFNQTIYFFHVPLFFLCSGYLYQKLSKVDSLYRWRQNACKKLIVLGIPYATFTVAVWCIKTLIPGAEENQMDGLLWTLFVKPTSPYWYLYCLFFVFLITPTVDNGRKALLRLAGALIMKMISLQNGVIPYAISLILINEVWFILGMNICWFDLTKVIGRFGWIATAAALLLLGSFAATAYKISSEMFGFLMGILGCTSVVGTFALIEAGGRKLRMLSWISKYTMPIFLMHTIFAATFRTVLLKIGVTSLGVHLPFGFLIAVAGPIVAADVMRRLKYPEFFLYPGKFIQIK